MAFGKLKKLIKKSPAKPKKGHVALEDDASAPSAPTAEGRDDVDQNDARATPVATNKSGELAAPSGSHTEADDVLDGILQDLNIKVGQLVVDEVRKTDTISEYSGGSARSVESEEESDEESGHDGVEEEQEEEGDDDDAEDEEEEEDEEEDEEEEVVHKLASPKSTASKKKKRKKKSSVSDRVAAVVAAAEEIKAKRERRTPPLPESSKKSEPVTPPTPLTEPGSQDDNGRKTPEVKEEGDAPVPPSPGLSKTSKASKKSSGSGNKKKTKNARSSPAPEEEGEEVEMPPSAPAKSQSELPPLPKTPAKKSRKSPLAFGKKRTATPTAERKTRSATPEFSPDVEVGMTEEQVMSASFDDQTDMSEDQGTLDEALNSLDEDTFLSQGGSLEEDLTIEEEDGIKAKKTVMNKDVVLHQPGGPSALVVRAMYYTPLPGNPDDIVIKVEASSVSFRDCLLRRGVGIDKVAFPFVPGCEVVGTISNLGKDARDEGYRVGDRVVAMTRHGGGNGYYAKIPMRYVAPILSTSIDAADAVCLVDVYMTAYQALRVAKKDGTPLTESNVLITDGFSPVGQACVALAKLEGADVYVTTTDLNQQDEYMKSLGVKCLPMAPNKWLPKIKGKMDVVIDNTCLDSYDSSWKALNPNGVLVCTGVTSIYSFQDYASGGCGGCEAFGDVRDYQARWAKMKANYLMSQTKFHDLWDSFQKEPKKYQQELKYLCFLVESGMLKPKISERVSIEEIADAQRYLETGKANGTIVCLP